jgi:hypothetical protein
VPMRVQNVLKFERVAVQQKQSVGKAPSRRNVWRMTNHARYSKVVFHPKKPLCNPVHQVTFLVSDDRDYEKSHSMIFLKR